MKHAPVPAALAVLAALLTATGASAAPGEPASPVPDHPTQNPMHYPRQDENAAAFIDMPMQAPLESVAGEEDPGAGLDAAG